MNLQKIFIGLLTSIVLISCATKRLTEADVTKKVEKARDANEEAREKSKEAIEARNQFTADYKAVQIEKIEKRIKGIDKQMKSIVKSGKNYANETVANSLDNAVEALKVEKAELTSKMKEIKSIQGENWQDNIAQIDSVMNIANRNLSEIDNSFKALPEKQ